MCDNGDLGPSTENGTDSASTPDQDLIQVGHYVVIQKQNYFKLHQLSAKCDIMLGKDRVSLSRIVGKPYWTSFKLVGKSGGKREFDLEEAENVETIQDTVKTESSGSDNRNINDDGKSQRLTTEEIAELRSSGLSAQTIVQKLIESSSTFVQKTEYSQEKYLKKKEKKYFEFITVRKPTLRLIAEIYFRDQFKIMGLRYDVLAQMLSYANVQSTGKYLLFENGSQALVGAAVLNCLGPGGALINLCPFTHPQKQAILSMNFTQEQKDRFLNVRIGDFVAALYPEQRTEPESEPLVALPMKRKHSEDDETSAKRPKWSDTFDKAVSILQTSKADGLIIAAKEFPLNIIDKMIPFVKPSRQLVVYSLHREPLLELYNQLKKRKIYVGLHLVENWLRTHQVLTDRTHPDVNMSASGGHLLYATVVEPS